MNKFAILCIDDELVVLESLKEQLKRHFGRKYYIEVAGSGGEALEIFEELKADGIEVPLTISDAHMPEMKGDEILIQIHQRSPKTLKILLTGRASADVVGNAVNQANLYRYITKPWDETDLILTVTEALRRYEQEQELAQKNEALQQLNASLEQKVIERTSQLQEAKKAAEAANRTKSQFIANMSHELRTPLNAILGFSQILAHDESLNSRQRENVEIINRSGEHLLTLINDILSISKIEAGQVVLHESCFNLHELLDELYQMLQLRARAKELQLVFERAIDVPQYVQTDESKLRQVLINLLGNAIKFTEKGKAILRVELGSGGDGEMGRWGDGETGRWGDGGAGEQGSRGTEETIQSKIQSLKSNRSVGYGSAAPMSPNSGGTSPSPDLKIGIIQNPKSEIQNRNVQNLKFEVEDTGIGIAAEDIERLFDPFIQTRTGYAAMEGTGLGLPISREFVRILGGDIQVWSAVGRGSTFAFDINVHPCSAAEVQTKTNPQRPIALEPNQMTYRILIVEDIAENRKMLVQMLEPLGFKVKEAENGRDAIALWHSWQPHLIFMDMRMPVMDGYEATRSIKAAAGDRGPIAIALTARAFEEDRQAIFAAGCDDILPKPLQENLLWQKLEQHLGVRYLYSTPAPPASPPELSKGLTEQALKKMSAEWLAGLHQSALEINYEKIQTAIAAISETEPALARSLIALVDDYRLDTLVELIQAVWET